MLLPSWARLSSAKEDLWRLSGFVIKQRSSRHERASRTGDDTTIITSSHNALLASKLPPQRQLMRGIDMYIYFFETRRSPVRVMLLRMILQIRNIKPKHFALFSGTI